MIMSSNLEEEILNDIKEQICPLLENKAVKDAILKILTSDRFEKSSSILRKISPLMINIGKSQEKRKDKTLIDAIMYLLEVEVISNLVIDILIMMLVAKGHIFHIEADEEYLFARHAVSIEDLNSSSVTLGMKVNYLQKNSVDCITKYVDKNLRNRIAHMDFEIDENGDFFIHEKKGKKKKKRYDIFSKLEKLVTFNSTVIDQIDLALEKT